MYLSTLLKICTKTNLSCKPKIINCLKPCVTCMYIRLKQKTCILCILSTLCSYVLNINRTVESFFSCINRFFFLIETVFFLYEVRAEFLYIC
jgi:hypothetical protein